MSNPRTLMKEALFRQLKAQVGVQLKTLEFKKLTNSWFIQKGPIHYFINLTKMSSAGSECLCVGVWFEILSTELLAVGNGSDFWDDYGGLPKPSPGLGQYAIDLDASYGDILGCYLLCEATDVPKCAGDIIENVRTVVTPMLTRIFSTDDLVDYLEENQHEARATTTKLRIWIENWRKQISG